MCISCAGMKRRMVTIIPVVLLFRHSGYSVIPAIPSFRRQPESRETGITLYV